MKIRRPWLIKLLGLAGAWVIRWWLATLRYRYEPIGPPLLPVYLEPGQRYIYVLWHENILLPTYQCRSPGVSVLVSRHADGELMAEVFRRLGVGLIRGSTTRGGVLAIRGMLRACQSVHLALTPDGPRGPRRRVQAGVIYLAAKAGLPIIALGVGYQNPWRLHSWDRFALPKPWRRATMMTSPPIAIPPDLDRDTLEAYRRQVEDTLRDVSERAEYLAKTGSPLQQERAAA